MAPGSRVRRKHKRDADRGKRHRGGGRERKWAAPRGSRRPSFPFRPSREGPPGNAQAIAIAPRRRRIQAPSPTKPMSIIAQVVGSGTPGIGGGSVPPSTESADLPRSHEPAIVIDVDGHLDVQAGGDVVEEVGAEGEAVAVNPLIGQPGKAAQQDPRAAVLGIDVVDLAAARVDVERADVQACARNRSTDRIVVPVPPVAEAPIIGVIVLLGVGGHEKPGRSLDCIGIGSVAGASGE